METRRAIKNKTGIYVNIPSEICKALDIRAGERLKVSYVTGQGIFITQLTGSDKIPIAPRSPEALQKNIDFMYSRVEKNLKNLESQAISNYHTSMIKEISRLGIFELQRKVDRLEKRVEESNKGKVKLSLVRQRKRSP